MTDLLFAPVATHAQSAENQKFNSEIKAVAGGFKNQEPPVRGLPNLTNQQPI